MIILIRKKKELTMPKKYKNPEEKETKLRNRNKKRS
jgi:hypothetical protein